MLDRTQRVGDGPKLFACYSENNASQVFGSLLKITNVLEAKDISVICLFENALIMFFSYFE